MINTSTNQPGRQPVHTVYGGAHLFAPDTATKLGAIAMRTLREYAPDAGVLAAALGLDRGRVSVKATRPEGLGLTGDGAGCIAIAAVRPAPS